jgi:zinc finger MYND domain-containing protein 10
MFQLYHEGCLLTLLELMLYHSSACESLGDSLVDLIDYCHRTLSRSIGAENDNQSPDCLSKQPSLKHLEIGHLEGSVVIRCIAVLRFISGHADRCSRLRYLFGQLLVWLVS